MAAGEKEQGSDAAAVLDASMEAGEVAAGSRSRDLRDSHSGEWSDLWGPGRQRAGGRGRPI